MANETTTTTSRTEQRLLQLDRLYPMTYAQHTDGSRVYFAVTYNHSTRPTFEWATVSREGNINSGGGHPKRSGFTKANGWTVDAEWIGAEW